jgi:hypothetical protein
MTTPKNNKPMKKEVLQWLKTLPEKYITISAGKMAYYQGLLVKKNGNIKKASPLAAFHYILRNAKGIEIQVKAGDQYYVIRP